MSACCLLFNFSFLDSEPSTKASLSIDVNYYLAHQIHPVVSRLVAPIDGTSPARIADCLGLDPSGYRRSNVTTVVDEDDENVSSHRTFCINFIFFPAT